MGRIKSLMIKRAAQQLYDGNDDFSEDFERNKKLLKNVIHYKLVRNKIAGGIVRLVKERRLKENEK